jgi:hypothetical protein
MNANMKKGLNNILQDKQFGMPGLHMQAIQKVAEVHNIVIGIRPVNKYALSLIAEGCPTKPFAVKNRSIKKRASVLAGFIAISPEYSQIEESQFQTHLNQLETAFNNDTDLRSIPCELSESRIHELKILFGDNIQIRSFANLNEYAISWKRKEKTITVSARKNTKNNDYTIYDEKGEPLQILGKEIVNFQGEKMLKPVTADYDLLVICPAYSDLDLRGKDRAVFSIEDPKRGSLNERTKEVLEAINAQIAEIDVNRQGVNLETVHHNTEFNNPCPVDPSDDLPCLIVLPQPMNVSLVATAEPCNETIIMIESMEELRKIFEIIHQKNYYWAPHAKYPDLRVPKHEEEMCQQNVG